MILITAISGGSIGSNISYNFATPIVRAVLNLAPTEVVVLCTSVGFIIGAGWAYISRNIFGWKPQAPVTDPHSAAGSGIAEGLEQEIDSDSYTEYQTLLAAPGSRSNNRASALLTHVTSAAAPLIGSMGSMMDYLKQLTHKPTISEYQFSNAGQATDIELNSLSVTPRQPSSSQVNRSTVAHPVFANSQPWLFKVNSYSSSNNHSLLPNDQAIQNLAAYQQHEKLSDNGKDYMAITFQNNMRLNVYADRIEISGSVEQSNKSFVEKACTDIIKLLGWQQFVANKHYNLSLTSSQFTAIHSPVPR